MAISSIVKIEGQSYPQDKSPVSISVDEGEQRQAASLTLSPNIVPQQKSDVFLTALKQSNKKAHKAPCALVLQAKFDDNDQAIHGAASQHLILQLAKTYQVVLKTIGKKTSLRTKIQQAAQETGQQVQLLCIMAHGENGKIRLGQLEPDCRDSCLAASDIDKWDFLKMHPEGKVVLCVCNAGLKFAQIMSDELGRIVLASKETLRPDLTFATQTGRVVSYLPNGDLNMTAFIPKGKPRSIFDIHAKEKQVLFSERLDYLEGQAKAGNASAQFSLGLFYHRGFGPCAPSEKTASKWYLLAAQQGFVRAQYIVGMAYLKGSKGFPKSEKLAAYWLHLAAEGGIASAQWMLGVGYEMGAGDLPRSPEQAMHWFSLAAKQGHENAQRRIAELQKASERLSPPVVEASVIATEV